MRMTPSQQQLVKNWIGTGSIEIWVKDILERSDGTGPGLTAESKIIDFFMQLPWHCANTETLFEKFDSSVKDFLYYSDFDYRPRTRQLHEILGSLVTYGVLVMVPNSGDFHLSPVLVALMQALEKAK